VRDFEDGVDRLAFLDLGVPPDTMVSITTGASNAGAGSFGTLPQLRVLQVANTGDAILYLDSALGGGTGAGGNAGFGRFEAAVYVVGGWNVSWDAGDVLFGTSADQLFA
jgi:hypothetical protein